MSELAAAARGPRAVAEDLRRAGGRIVWTLGTDIPRALVDAFGLHPVRLVPDMGVDSAAIDALIGADNLGARGRALLAQIAALPAGDALLISHADAEQPQLFATLRELVRCGVMAKPEVHFLDLLTIDRPATRAYNRRRVEQAADWLGGLSGREGDFGAAIAAQGMLANRTAPLAALRAERRLSGVAVHEIAAAAAILPVARWCALVDAVLADPPAPQPGIPTLLGGGTIEELDLIDRIEAAGMLVVAEDHGWGLDRLSQRLDGAADPLDALAAFALSPRYGPFADVAPRAVVAAGRVAALAPERLLHVRVRGEESAPWEWHAMRDLGVPALHLTLPAETDRLAAFDVPPPVRTPDEAAPARPRPAPPPRSRKSLDAVAKLGSYQRDWFARLRAEAAAGIPIAAVNANAPQETLRAMGIPFVVNQWWASIVAAKQQSGRYGDLLEAQGLPRAVEAYSAQGVAAAYDMDAALAPWGGLPTPTVIEMVAGTDATVGLAEAWRDATAAALFDFHRSIESRWDIPVAWWDDLPEHWDRAIEPERLDLLEAELRESIAMIAAACHRDFDADRFVAVLDLVNEQQEYYRRTRDLVAATVPAPIGLVDQMPATMIPQWHRGTEWARDAARDFYEEVAQRVADGEAACPGERIRLMFVGRGIWSDMSFYQRWEESHGAVFVCSMYLSLASDGYIRRHEGRDPMRALAARFVTMGDELRMPTWAGAWHVKEARLHQCDGAVALDDADPLVLRALRDAGIPVVELGFDNYGEAGDAVEAKMRAFLEGPAAAASAARHGR